jgi:hypothetical protein
VRRREEPFAWVRVEVVREMGRGEEGRREEGRRGGVCERCAWRRAGGEMRGMAEGGMIVVVEGGREGIVGGALVVGSGGEGEKNVFTSCYCPQFGS